MDPIDKFLRDGADVSSLVDSFRDCIVKGGIELRCNDERAKIYVEILKQGWEQLQVLASRYPDSQFIQQEINHVLDLAKRKLPEDLYKDIYEHSS